MARGPVSLEQISLPKVMACGYGKAGSGKTVWSCGSQNQPTFVFDVDQGMFSARSFSGNAQFPSVNRKLVHVWEVKNKKDFFDGYAYLVNNYRNYGLVTVDTATELQKVLMQEVMEKAGHVIPAIQDWGVVLQVMESLARQMRTLPMNVIWLCHEVVSENPESRRLMYRPSFQGSLSREYAKHFDLICRYCLIDQQMKGQDNQMHSVSYRFLQCQPDQVTEAKDRSGILDKFELPLIDNLLNKMLLQSQRS